MDSSPRPRILLLSLIALGLALVASASGCSGDDDVIQADAGPPPDLCSNGVKDPGELGLDCGGTCTEACPPPSDCSNGAKDGDEAGVDCGGSCAHACLPAGPCETEEECGAGNLCVADPADDFRSAVKTCAARLPSCAGDPCGADTWCYFGWDGAGNAAAYCVPRNAIGELCSESNDKDVNTCAAGAHCAIDDASSDSHCVAGNPPAGLPAGRHCLNDVDCANGLACDAIADVCTPRAAQGGECSGWNGQCDTGLQCAMPEGLRCDTWLDCGSQMDCCATDSGSECRAYDGHDHCAPPTGACVAETHDF